MRKAVLTLLFISIAMMGNAQNIEMKKTFGGYKFSQNGTNLRLSEVVDAMKSNEQSYNLAKAARSNYVWSSVLGGAGGLLIGWPLGTAIAGGDANWTLAGIGAGLVVVGIPITSKANKKMKKAIATYNTSLSTSAVDIKYQFILNGSGAGIALTF